MYSPRRTHTHAKKRDRNFSRANVSPVLNTYIEVNLITAVQMTMSVMSSSFRSWGAVVMAVTMATVFLPSGSAFRVLLVPANIKSHYTMFLRFGQALVAEGHEVVMAAGSNAPCLDKLRKSSLTIHEYQGFGAVPVAHTDKISELLLKVRFTTSKVEFIQLLAKAVEIYEENLGGECLNMLRDKALRKDLENYHFDFAVTDYVAAPCTLNLPVLLKVPYGVFSIPVLPWIYRKPDLMSFAPNLIFSDFTDRMTFAERVQNVGMAMLARFTQNLTNMADGREFPELAAYSNSESLMAEAKFWFILEDISMTYPRSAMPNTESVGDLMVQNAGELPQDFQEFMDNSPEGVILFSFGSYLNMDMVPADVLAKFCWALSRTSQKVVWKTEQPAPCGLAAENPWVARRLKVVPWMPQTDLLAHPNLHLFVTHGGLNSALEALYHAKPMLAFPITLDQPFNGKLIQTKGYGHLMDITDFTGEEFLSRIQETVGNASIKDALRKGSDILKFKATPVSKRIAFWVEHVVKYGDSHLRSAAFDLHVLQFYMVDVFLFLLGALCGVILMAAGLLWCLIKCVKRCCWRGGRKAKVE